jgi:hypothetical protein
MTAPTLDLLRCWIARKLELWLWWAGARYRMHRRKRHRAIERKMLGRT